MAAKLGNTVMRVGVNTQDLRASSNKLNNIVYHYIIKQFLFTSNMIIKRTSPKSNGVADFSNADAGISFFREQRSRYAQDPLALIFRYNAPEVWI